MDYARHVAIATSCPTEKTSKFRSTSQSGYTYSSPSTGKNLYPKLDSTRSTIPSKPNTPQNPLMTKAHPTPTFTRTRHLSKSEWEERRRLVLCFRCGQKYTPQHKFSAGQLRIMLLADGDEISDDGGGEIAWNRSSCWHPCGWRIPISRALWGYYWFFIHWP